MKIHQRFISTIAVLCIILNIFPAFPVNAESGPEEPMFYANIEYSSQGYLVKGTFMDFPSDVCLVQPLYSLDQETYQACGVPWDLKALGTEDPDALKILQNQICLYDSMEPLKSYLEGNIDRFYLKLQLTQKNGDTYETQAAVIDRGTPQPVPEGFTLLAKFTSNMLVRETNSRRYYGKYQLTIRETAAPEDISPFLPDTIPVEVHLQNGIEHVTSCIIDCPITWKPLSFSNFTAGESITIADAAEEIIIPGGTFLNTPLGTFQLDAPLSLNQSILTDEVRLILNVIAADENPTGVLTADNDGLELAFDLKPTGATALRVYTYSEGGFEWTELSNIPLPDAAYDQPSTPNSGYLTVLGNTQEPYQSYLAAMNAGDDPTPFLVGVEIQGGVYDGRQLILAWPGTYDLPLSLPKFGGAEGNEGNAGADNKNDSTQEGQRPNLPQIPEEPPKDPSPDTNEENGGNPNQEQPGSGQEPEDGVPQQPGSNQEPDDNAPQQPGSGQEPDNNAPQQPGSNQESDDSTTQQPDTGKDSDDPSAQQPDTGKEPDASIQRPSSNEKEDDPSGPKPGSYENQENPADPRPGSEHETEHNRNPSANAKSEPQKQQTPSKSYTSNGISALPEPSALAPNTADTNTEKINPSTSLASNKQNDARKNSSIHSPTIKIPVSALSLVTTTEEENIRKHGTRHLGYLFLTLAIVGACMAAAAKLIKDSLRS